MNTTDKILTHEKRATLRSMSLYWHEVAKREDTFPLEHELGAVGSMLGTDILFIIARYIELTKEDE